MSRVCLALLPLCLAIATPARAHTQIPGVNAFTGGFLEPFFQPPVLVAVVALALLVGSVGMRHLSPVFAAFLAALIAGMLLRWYAPLPPTQLMILSIVAMSAGGWTALFRPVPWHAGMLLAGLGALLAGFELAPHEPGFWPRVGSGLGAGFSVTLLFLNLVALAAFLRGRDLAIVLRVAGSWCAAIGLLLAGQAFLA